ncbi:MAG: MjaI family restriction endonuclease, partial [Rhabdochlamydiaceae bacterium]
WETWYFEHAVTAGKNPSRITREMLQELGERLYVKIKEIVIPEWTDAFTQLSLEDCIDYIYNLTIHRTFDGFIREKSVVEDTLVTRFPTVRFEQSDPQLDHAGDIDYLGWVGQKTFGIQIKPVTSRSNFGNYSASERMRASFEAFTAKYGGRVFIVYSVGDEIANQNVIEEIEAEVNKLRS